MRILFACCLSAICLALLAAEAEADEVFELRGGVVVRGYVMRESADTLTIRLTGFTQPTTVTVKRLNVVRRYANGQSPPAPTPKSAVERSPTETASARSVRPGQLRLSRSFRAGSAEERTSSYLSIDDETFLERFIRLAKVAIPNNLHSRLSVGFLLILITTLMVGAGTRLADIEAPSFGGTVICGLLFAGVFAADALLYNQLLRADRAIWVVPLQVVGWIGAARLLLGGSVPRAMLLFAFVLVSLLTVIFATGAVFVTV